MEIWFEFGGAWPQTFVCGGALVALLRISEALTSPSFAVGSVVSNSGVLRFYLRCCDLYYIPRYLLNLLNNVKDSLPALIPMEGKTPLLLILILRSIFK